MHSITLLWYRKNLNFIIFLQYFSDENLINCVRNSQSICFQNFNHLLKKKFQMLLHFNQIWRRECLKYKTNKSIASLWFPMINLVSSKSNLTLFLFLYFVGFTYIIGACVLIFARVHNTPTIQSRISLT